MLQDIKLQKSYRSNQNNILKEFYLPCLKNSILYQRSVGFFSSSILPVISVGLEDFIKNGGKIQVITSPYLSKEDIFSIKKGDLWRERNRSSSTFSLITENFFLEDQYKLLEEFVSRNIIEIKIAVVNNTQYGIYHEKIGVFFDGHDYVVFNGSLNETETALLHNFESIEVYRSWLPEERERALEKKNWFEELWNYRSKDVEVFPFTEAIRRSLIKVRQVNSKMSNDTISERYEVPDGCPKLPEDIILRSYQREAVDKWFNSGMMGIFKMATGSGKTITSLSVVERCYAEHGLKAVIIVVPYRHLVSQWAKEVKRFGLKPLMCFENRSNWINLLQANLYAINSGTLEFLTVITTNATFSSNAFQSTIDFFPDETLIIGDEAHNLGSSKLLESLPQKITKRLALSATPERWFDEVGTAGLFQYFGPVLMEFTLKDAIREGALVPYRYCPLFVTLTDEESEAYLEISRKIAKTIGMNDTNPEYSQSAQALLIQRARIIASAKNKLQVLRELMSTRLDTSHTLFYCGDGTVEEPTSEETLRQIEAVTKLLGYELGYRVDMYTAETPLSEREDLRSKFDSGELQGLVAIRCLDEGVDIPSVRTAVILASSSNPRQFIQRRGRVLRRFPGKKEATIFDMIVLPPKSKEAYYESEKRLVRNEFQRYLEFAELAVNAGEVRGKLIEKLNEYSMLDVKE